MEALEVQVGGDHYKNTPYQPVKFSVDLHLNFIQGNIVKYVTRYKQKNGKQDLEKVVHYAMIGQELNPSNYYVSSEMSRKYFSDYCTMNNLDELVSEIIEGVIYQNWVKIVANTGRLIKRDYGTVH